MLGVNATTDSVSRLKKVALAPNIGLEGFLEFAHSGDQQDPYPQKRGLLERFSEDDI
jgi:hypothetical protein